MIPVFKMLSRLTLSPSCSTGQRVAVARWLLSAALRCHPGSMKLDRRLGALLILVGGLLDAARLLVFIGFVSADLGTPASIAVYAIPSICVGVGLILIGISIRGRGRPPLVVAGILNLAVVVVNVIQIAWHSPLGPGPSGLAELVYLASVLVAAALLLSDSSLHGPARWAIAIPAACIVLFLVSIVFLPLQWARFDVLSAIGFAVVGVLLLRRTRLQHAPTSPHDK
jgi:hypothetical protein